MRFSKKQKKAQIASMDLIISAIILLFLISIMIIIILKVSDNKTEKVIYGGEVFRNIEKIDDQNIAFLNNYKIDETKLSEFADTTYQTYDEMKEKMFAGSDNYNIYTNEVCMFFDNYTISGYQAIPINGDNQLGHSECYYDNPCKGFDIAVPFAKPVLRKGSIVMMYVVVCG